MREKILYLFLAIGWIGCSTQEESISFDPGLSLIFSTDTVAFDTLLSERRSSTRRLTVFNPNREAIQLSEIALGKNQRSDYQVIINGKQANRLENEQLFGGDSLLILVEVIITPQNRDLPYLVKDSIIFRWNGNSEHVKLVSYGQDVNEASQIICDEVWTNARPYIVSDTLIVGSDCTLRMEPGTRLFFENDAIMFVQGTLLALGDSAENILFRNARFDGIYDQVPGQWNGIYFLEGSSGNEITFAQIFNGQVGLRVGTPDEDDIPDVTISNTRIFNMSTAGILAFTSDVQAQNTLIYNCGTYLVGGFAGGNYTYLHCTFSNEPAFFVQDEPTVQFSDNLVLGPDNVISDDLTVSIFNTIIWGTADEELLVNNGAGQEVSLALRSNIIRSQNDLEGNFTSTEPDFPGFTNAFFNEYNLDTLAFAKDKGSDIGITLDILGMPRDEFPDIGAFERIERKQ